MVREVPLEVELPETDVSNAFQVLFGNEEAVVAYHTKTNPGSEPEVTPWEQQHRTVRFTLDLSTSIPQFLKRVVGVSVVKVTETQTVAWEGREVVRIDSSPILDMVGGKQFTTAAAFTMERSSSGKHVQMRALVSCTAHGPWGMQSTIEGVMAEQAKQSLGVFLTFCQAYCRAANPAAQMPHTPGDAGLDVGDGEQFFDAADSMLVALSNGAPASASLKPSGDLADAASTAGLALQLGRVVGLLESMERRMSTLQQSVDRLQGAANGLGGWSSSSVACSFLAGSCLAAAGVLVVVQLHARRIGG